MEGVNYPHMRSIGVDLSRYTASAKPEAKYARCMESKTAHYLVDAERFGDNRLKLTTCECQGK
jgi:hypothetical protein